MVNDTRVENAESIPLIWDAFLQDNHWTENETNNTRKERQELLMYFLERET